MNEMEARQFILSALAPQTHLGDTRYCYDSRLSYMTDAQAAAWFRSSATSTIKQESAEVQLIGTYRDEMFGQGGPYTIIDLGCGDGENAALIIATAYAAGFVVHRYIAVDVNSTFLQTAIDRVISNTHLTADQCRAIRMNFEDFAEIDRTVLAQDNTKTLVYLFLGGTFSNFALGTIVPILDRRVRSHDRLIIGTSCRTGETPEEQDQLIATSASYAHDLDYSFAQLLGIESNEVSLKITYNSAEHRTERWLTIAQPSQWMVENGLGDVRRILRLVAYKPTKTEVEKALSPIFHVRTFAFTTGSYYLFLCEKGRE